jgi:hypothetical protein
MRYAACLAMCISAVLCSAVVSGGYGDYYTPASSTVPVYSGPDKAFRITTYVGPDDVVMEQGFSRVRGFVEVYLPSRSHSRGYVLATDLVSVATPRGFSDTPPPAIRRPEESPAREEGQAASRAAGEPSVSSYLPYIAIVLAVVVAVLATATLLIYSVPPVRSGKNDQGLGKLAGKAGSLIAPLLTLFQRRRADVARPTRSTAVTRDEGFRDEIVSDVSQHQTKKQIATPPRLPAEGDAAEFGNTETPEDEALLAFVMEEFASGVRLPDLWSKALADASGDARKAERRYLELRMDALSGAAASLDDRR